MDSDPGGNNGALEGPSSTPPLCLVVRGGPSPSRQYALGEDQHPSGRWKGSARGLHSQLGEGTEGTDGAADRQDLSWSVLSWLMWSFPGSCILTGLSGSVGGVTGSSSGRLPGALARPCLVALRDPRGVHQLGSS